LKYGVLERQDAWAEDIKIQKDRISFKACFKNKDSVEIEAAVVGEQNVLNLLAAVSVARKLGMELKDIASACKKMKPEKRIFSFQGIDIVDFSYSSNLNGVLDSPRAFEALARKETSDYALFDRAGPRL